jgi:hypothetical protein
VDIQRLLGCSLESLETNTAFRCLGRLTISALSLHLSKQKAYSIGFQLGSRSGIGTLLLGDLTLVNSFSSLSVSLCLDWDFDSQLTFPPPIVIYSTVVKEVRGWGKE